MKFNYVIKCDLNLNRMNLIICRYRKIKSKTNSLSFLYENDQIKIDFPKTSNLIYFKKKKDKY